MDEVLTPILQILAKSKMPPSPSPFLNIPDRPVRMLPPSTIFPPKQPRKPSTKDFDRLSLLMTSTDMCQTRSFKYRFNALFNARSQYVVDKVAARDAFYMMTDSLSKIGQSGSSCKDQKVPCSFLKFSRNEEACLIAERVNVIYKHIVNGCTTQWVKEHDTVMSTLFQSSISIENSECSPVGTELKKDKTRRLNDLYKLEFGKSLQSAMAEAVTSRRRQKNESTPDNERLTIRETKFALKEKMHALKINKRYENRQKNKTQNKTQRATRKLTGTDDNSIGNCSIATSSSANLTLLQNTAQGRLNLLTKSMTATIELKSSKRLIKQFASFLDYIHAGFRKCPAIRLDCIDYNPLYGDDTTASFDELIIHASNIVGQVQSQCDFEQ